MNMNMKVINSNTNSNKCLYNTYYIYTVLSLHFAPHTDRVASEQQLAHVYQAEFVAGGISYKQSVSCDVDVSLQPVEQRVEQCAVSVSAEEDESLPQQSEQCL